MEESCHMLLADKKSLTAVVEWSMQNKYLLYKEKGIYSVCVGTALKSVTDSYKNQSLICISVINLRLQATLKRLSDLL